MEFNTNNSYFSISKEAGEDIEKILAPASYGSKDDQQRRFQDIRKIIVSSFHDAVEELPSRELHCFYKVRMSTVGKDVGFYCIVRSGAPDGILKYTVTLVGVVDGSDIDRFVANRRFLHTVYERIKKAFRR